MHILYLHEYLCPPGGSGNNRSLELARKWVAAGAQVTFITSDAYFPASMKRNSGSWETEIEGMRVHVVDAPYDHMMPFRQRVRAWLRFYRRGMALARQLEADFDLIYASSTPPTVGEMGRKLSRRWGIPYVFEAVDVWPDVPIGMGILRNRLLISWLNARVDRIYRDAARIVALSEGMREQVLQHHPHPDRVLTMHNGCDTAAFPYVERPDRRPVRAVYTGTVGLANGVEAIVDAAVAAEQAGFSDLEFVVLGGGNALEQVKAYAAAKAPGNLQFLDRIPKEEVPAFLQRADIGLVCFAEHAVLEANSANKFYDYQASGLPVVLNYQGWQAEYLDRYQSGLCSPQGDAAAFAANILALARDYPRRRQMGLQGRRMVEAHFDRGRIAERLLELFREVLASA